MRIRAISLTLAAVLVAAAATLTACAGSGTSSPSAAPSLADPTATGREQVTRFLSLLQAGDTAGLDAFLDPAFQLQRSDGSGATKAEYLANPAKVKSFELGPDLVVVQSGLVMTVRWSLVADETINGQQQSTGLAPRLSTFVWSDGGWKLLSHANFNVPTT